MRTYSLLPLLLSLCVSALWAQAPSTSRPLTPSQQRAVEQHLARYRANPESAIVLELVKLGPAGRTFLEQKLTKAPERGEISKMLGAMDHLEGRDLFNKEVSVRPWPWSLRTFMVGEVLVVKGIGEWAGIRVDPAQKPGSETLKVELAITKDPLAPLGGGGVARTTITAQGSDPVIEPGRARAYRSRDFSFSVFGSEVVLRSVGAEAFRYRHHVRSLPVAFTSERDFKKVKAGNSGFTYRDRPDEDMLRHARRIQQYLYRILDGVDPLPTYDTPDEDRFAYAEAVQVEIREGSDGSRTCLVAFPDLQPGIYTADSHFLLSRFSLEAGGFASKDILVWNGNHEAHEANAFWNGKDFAPPPADLVKRIRRLFPEDY